MSSDSVLVGVQDAYKVYRMGAVDVKALHGMNLTVHRGEFVAVTGPSGSGKTTLLNIIGLLDKPTSGSVEIEGQDVWRFSARKKADFRLRRFGFIFQFYNLFGELTAIENIILPAIAAGTPKSQYIAKATTLLKAVGLEKRLRHFPHQLSGGEQQRVAIARALMNEPILILTDEPTANIDSENAARIVEILSGLNRSRGVTIMMATHDRELANKAARIIELKDGFVVRETKGQD